MLICSTDVDEHARGARLDFTSLTTENIYRKKLILTAGDLVLKPSSVITRTQYKLTGH